MTFVADFHIHSRYSRATSRELCFEHLHAWGRRKGVSLIGTGDCTHPGWLAEIKEKLTPAEDGLFRLREELVPAVDVAPAWSEDVRFLISGEVSTIYKAGGATRKVHHVIILPGIEEAEEFAGRLARIGNIASDGRPILGLDSRDLLETLLEASPDAVLIPAHIWTPWFSVLGSKSGFDAVEACYRDLAGYIFAVETGLSSDPPMNWTVSQLDRYALVSNSDAHSPAKLGREANLFTCEMGYTAVMSALKRAAPGGLWGTLEFFPQEGKYHYDGHRKCNFSCAPEESKRHGGRCPVCGGPLTLGVEYRVTELADRPRGSAPTGALRYRSLLPLAEILGEVHETSEAGKKVQQLYDKLLAEVGPELYVLMEADAEQIAASGGVLLAIAIEKVRAGKVHATPGYDGEYGIIKVFSDQERAEVRGQALLFTGLSAGGEKVRGAGGGRARSAEATLPISAEAPAVEGLSEEQQRAVRYPPAPLIIAAGPGAGKTRTLVERIKWLMAEGGVAPSSVLALTFSNRAAREMTERLGAGLAQLPGSGRPTVATFHKLGFMMIAEGREMLGLQTPLAILSEDEADDLFDQAAPARPRTAAVASLDEMERKLAAIYADASGDPASVRELAAEARRLAPEYAASKRERGALDFTDLLILPLMLLAEHEEIRRGYQRRWPHVLVDEYQDVNVFQYHLLRLLCPPGGDLCVIGDPDQAIYGFRGADVRYFLRFQRDYPDAGQIALARNYRSCRTIVEASGQVMARGSLLGRRELWSDLPGPAHVEVTALPTPQAEAEYVVQTIEGLLGGISYFSVDSGRSGDGVGEHLGFNDIAVLYRTHAMGEDLQQAFERSGIPYQRAARKDIFQRPDIRKTLAWLEQAQAQGGAAAVDQGEGGAVRAILQACLALGIPEEALREAPWLALLQRAEGAEDLAAFLQGAKLERDIDSFDPRAARVALMTVHAAKGLEWDVVFMIGCEGGAFPHPATPEEEERRLFYVGMTRARAHLFLSYPRTRVLRGERAPREMSPFLRDISAELLRVTTPALKARKRDTQLAMTDLLFEE